MCRLMGGKGVSVTATSISEVVYQGRTDRMMKGMKDDEGDSDCE